MIPFMVSNSSNRRVNEDIHAPKINLIAPDGRNMGVVETRIARSLADELELDLVEMNPNARPPVVKITDYSKIRYQEQQREKQARKVAKSQEVKELRFRPVTNEHDLETKIRQAEKFLSKGHRLRLLVQMKGRERGRSGDAIDLLERIASRLNSNAKLVQAPSVDGRVAIMVLAPVKQ